jgi:hypothetical protein
MIVSVNAYVFLGEIVGTLSVIDRGADGLLFTAASCQIRGKGSWDDQTADPHDLAQAALEACMDALWG